MVKDISDLEGLVIVGEIGGASWTAMWDVKSLRYVYGWIEIPKYDPK